MSEEFSLSQGKTWQLCHLILGYSRESAEQPLSCTRFDHDQGLI
jgi:hypothetical protein